MRVTSRPPRFRTSGRPARILLGAPLVNEAPTTKLTLPPAVYGSSTERAARAGTSQSLPWEVAEALRSGDHGCDRQFDRFLPLRLQAVSARYWSPLRVAARAAAWLDELDIRTLVDIGSGAGKFCVATALMSRCAFLGVEHRKDLVATARALAAVFGVQSRVSFVEETFGDTPPPAAECYYFYNPFLEGMLEPEAWLDDRVEHGERRYDRELLAVEDWLGRAPVGTYVLTYNGLGIDLPLAYREIRTDRTFPCNLRLYRKTFEQR